MSLQLHKYLLLAAVTAGIAGCSGKIVPSAQETARPPAPLFAEDFEAGTLNPAVWTQQITGANTITVQREKVAHGNFALRVDCPARTNKTWAFVSTDHLPDVLKTHHFGRAYVLITPAPPARHTIFIMAGTPGFPKNKFQEIATANGKWQLTYVDLTGAQDREDYHAGGPLPLDRWVCLEWEFNDQPNHTTIWVDGEMVQETGFISRNSGKNSDLIGSFTDYSFGFRFWGDVLTPFSIYFDDIQLDTHRIGPFGKK